MCYNTRFLCLHERQKQSKARSGRVCCNLAFSWGNGCALCAAIPQPATIQHIFFLLSIQIESHLQNIAETRKRKEAFCFCCTSFLKWPRRMLRFNHVIILDCSSHFELILCAILWKNFLYYSQASGCSFPAMRSLNCHENVCIGIYMCNIISQKDVIRVDEIRFEAADMPCHRMAKT